MTERHEPVLQPPLTFARRGATAHEPESSAASFQLAVRLGATGLRSEVWRTSDGHPVLARNGTVRRGLRRRPIRDLRRDELSELLTLDDLYDEVGTGLHLCLDIRDDDVVDAVVGTASDRGAGGDGAPLRQLWLCHADWERLAGWRGRYPDVRLVDRARLHQMADGPERRAAQLGRAGIDAVDMPYPDWTGGLVILFRRFQVLSFGSDAEHDRMLDDLLRMGLDAVSSNHVDRMVEALRRAGWGLPTGS